MKKLTSKTKTLFFCLILLISAFSVPAIMLVQSQAQPYFKITFLIPGANPSRQAYSEIVEAAMDSVGIDARRVQEPWGTCYDLALTPNAETVGKTYDEGGFDAIFVGYAMGIDPEPYALYDSSQFPPAGQNYNLWNNSESDRLCRLINEETVEATRLQYVKEWQALAYNEIPEPCIYYGKEVVAYDPTALKPEPFTLHHYPAWPRVKNWELVTDTAADSIVIAQTGPAPTEGLTDLLSTSYYDLTIFDNIYDSLAERQDLKDKKMVPSLATGWEVAADKKTWTVHLRNDVKWHDGVAFTAADVKFTYDAYMNDDYGSSQGAWYKGIVGEGNVVVVDDYTVQFNLPKPYAYFVENVLSEYLLPKHVLESIPPADLKNHPFNTASGTYTVEGYTMAGPIGTGPYIFVAYDPSTASNELVKNPDYWDKAALEAAGQFQIETLYVQCIEDSDPAIAALKAGDVDVLDSQYQIMAKLDRLEPAWGAFVSYDGFATQQMGFNLNHPVWGTGVDTPLGKQDPSRAAEGARYVRQALNHLIDREGIIEAVLGGYGSPGITVPVTKITAGFDASLPEYTYDPTLAKSLLAAAGYDTGVAPPAGDFLQQYGLYIAVVIVIVVIVVVALLLMKRRKPT